VVVLIAMLPTSRKKREKWGTRTAFLAFLRKSVSAWISPSRSVISAEVLRWGSLASRATPLPQDDSCWIGIGQQRAHVSCGLRGSESMERFSLGENCGALLQGEGETYSGDWRESRISTAGALVPAGPRSTPWHVWRDFVKDVVRLCSQCIFSDDCHSEPASAGEESAVRSGGREADSSLCSE
jgi:hypothetical protein